MTQAPRPSTDGLEGVVVGQTRLSRVDGQAGRLTLAGYPVETLAPAVPFEHVLHLLLHDRLPTPDEARALSTTLAAARHLSPEVLNVVTATASRGATAMHALRLGVAAVGLAAPGPLAIVGAMPALVGAVVRVGRGESPCPPDDSHDHASATLAMIRGHAPTRAEADALSTYLSTVSDHGMNASTFTARVVASTGSDLAASIEAALGALAGPLHGGAPGPALEALLQLRREGDADSLDARTRAWVRTEVAAGRRIMGFGHRVYRVRDPRADVLLAAAKRLLADDPLLRDAKVHETAVLETLHELKPGRVLATNVEFATALLLQGLGLTPDLFTAVFAVGRVAGWAAHVAEQQRTGRLIRPRAQYCGAEHRVLA